VDKCAGGPDGHARQANARRCEQKLILPGDIQPYGRATVYSRVNGYLKSWNTDIGGACEGE